MIKYKKKDLKSPVKAPSIPKNNQESYNPKNSRHNLGEGKKASKNLNNKDYKLSEDQKKKKKTVLVCMDEKAELWL